MRIRLLLCCCTMLLVAGCSGQDAAAPQPVASPLQASAGTIPTVAALEPKLVVQLAHQAPVLAVRWVDGGQHLASLASDGSIVFWNVANGAILDHAQLPLDPQSLAPHELYKATLRFRAFTEGPDPDTLLVTYAGVKDGVGMEDVDANAKLAQFQRGDARQLR